MAPASRRKYRFSNAIMASGMEIGPRQRFPVFVVGGTIKRISFDTEAGLVWEKEMLGVFEILSSSPVC